MGLFKKKPKIVTLSLASPLDGMIVPLEEIPDETFSGKILGQGIGIIPSYGVLRASDDGEVLSVADTKHAIVVRYISGIEVLMHIGIDTVELGGSGYNPHVSAGHIIEKGDILIEFDIDEIKNKGYNPVTPIIITNSEEFNNISENSGAIKAGDELLILEK